MENIEKDILIKLNNLVKAIMANTRSWYEMAYVNQIYANRHKEEFEEVFAMVKEFMDLWFEKIDSTDAQDTDEIYKEMRAEHYDRFKEIFDWYDDKGDETMVDVTGKPFSQEDWDAEPKGNGGEERL